MAKPLKPARGKSADVKIDEIVSQRNDLPAEPVLRCDECQRATYPDWARCTKCTHYFCSDCHETHGCGTEFKCAEQIEAEAEAAGAGTGIEIVSQRNDLPAAAEPEPSLEIVSQRNDLPTDDAALMGMVLKDTKPTGRGSWKKAKALQQEIRDSAIRGITAQILLGSELQSIKEKLGETRGVGETGSFEDSVREQLGISKATAWRYMQLAEGAEAHCKELADLRSTGASLDKILPVLCAITEGKSQKDLLLEWGVVAEAPPETPKIGGRTAGSIGKPPVSEDSLAEACEEKWRTLTEEVEAEISTESYSRLDAGILTEALAAMSQASKVLTDQLRKLKNQPDAEPATAKPAKKSKKQAALEEQTFTCAECGAAGLTREAFLAHECPATDIS